MRSQKTSGMPLRPTTGFGKSKETIINDLQNHTENSFTKEWMIELSVLKDNHLIKLIG